MTNDGQAVPVYTIDVEIVRLIDPHQPGWVECLLRDASGRAWTIIEKVPIVSDAQLDETSTYPQVGEVACELVRQWTDEHGRTRCIIDTARPYTGDTSDGCFTGDKPSNAYGYGIVDVYEAVKQALGK